MSFIAAPALDAFVSFGLASSGEPLFTPLLFEVELETYLSSALGVPAWAGLIPPGVSTKSFPALVYTLVSTDQDETLDGPTDIVAWTVQIDAYGRTIYAAALLIERVKSILHGFSGMMGNAEVENCLRSNESHGLDVLPDASALGMHRRMAEYTIWFRESNLTFN